MVFLLVPMCSFRPNYLSRLNWTILVSIGSTAVVLPGVPNKSFVFKSHYNSIGQPIQDTIFNLRCQ